jgi:DNA modification methylase
MGTLMDKRVLANIPNNSIKTIEKDNNFHAFITGNSMEILKLFPDDSIDLIITDPPYNRNLNYGVYSNDNKKQDEYYAECQKWLGECARVLSKKGSFYLISYPEINARQLPYIEDKLKLKFKRWITWHYPTNIGHSKANFTRSQRSILFFTKSSDYVFNRENLIQHYKNPEVSKIKKRIESGSEGRTSYDVLRFIDLVELNKGLIDVLDVNLLKNVCKDRIGSKKCNDKNHHPCQLPPALLRILVKVSSNPGDVLLDPFAGTFTLSSVAAELERNSVGIEINPDYVKLGLKRFKL